MSIDALFDLDDRTFAEPQQRVMVMWYPDWPVFAATEHNELADKPVAIFDKGAVLACSALARQYGIKRGMRSRDAQSRCPSLHSISYNPAADARAFEPVLRAIEQISPSIEAIRPGICATGASGPTRYFGSENAVIDAIGEHLLSLGYPDARFGIADGTFAATQAARIDIVVPPGGTAQFLADLPVSTLDRPELANVLRRMGLRTLGAFASLPTTQVAARFGADGTCAHRLAAGREQRSLAVRTPPADLTLLIDLDPPHERVDTIAFATRARSDDLVAALAARDLVATALRITLRTEDGGFSERVWRHPRWFDSTDLVDRVRWQVQAATPADTGAAAGIHAGGMLSSPITSILITPHTVERIGIHADGLWGDKSPDERIHRAFARIQSMLDHTAVLTPVRSGGRSPAEHTTMVPWGQAATPQRELAAPWPGRLPDPAPSQVLPIPLSVQVRSTAGPILPTERGVLDGEPHTLIYRHGRAALIDAWAGPWMSDERWWDRGSARTLTRIQVTTEDAAYLLIYTGTQWWIEATYD